MSAFMSLRIISVYADDLCLQTSASTVILLKRYCSEDQFMNVVFSLKPRMITITYLPTVPI